MRILPRRDSSLVLVDLPVDLDQKGVGIQRWVRRTLVVPLVQCDDHYVDVVEVVSICSLHPQFREICFMKEGIRGTLISHAQRT
jgi:hypothetical protein